MAKVTSTEKLKLEFETTGGKEYSFSLDNPDKDVAEATMVAKANAVVSSGAVLVEGEALAAVKGISIVKTEKTVYDLEATE